MLKSEDEVFQKFKEFKVLLENKTGKKIKKLRTDNGLEFCAELFNVIICLGDRKSTRLNSSHSS